jgi:hypothetical protein
MDVEIGTEAAQFPEKEYINWIFVALWVCIMRQKEILLRCFHLVSITLSSVFTINHELGVS